VYSHCKTSQCARFSAVGQQEGSRHASRTCISWMNALVSTSSPASGVAFCSAPPPSSIGLAAACSHHRPIEVSATRLRSTGCALLVYNYTCNRGGLTLWCAQGVGVAASSSRQTASCTFQPPHLHVLTFSTTSYTKPSNTQLLTSAMPHAMACVPRSRIAIDLLAGLRLLDRFWDLRLAWVPSVE
jgi:hypothetical protein